MKKETLKTAIENLPDRYIEEALQPVKKKKRYRHKILGLAAAFSICLGAVFFLPNLAAYKTRSAHSSESDRTQSESVFADLSVIVYAAETENPQAEEITLQKGIEAEFSSYSPLMSSVPGMEFSFSYGDRKDVTFCATSDKYGMLEKYNVSDEGYWSVSDYASSISCTAGEHIYWIPQFPEKEESCITVDVISDGNVIDTKTITIQATDDFLYTAVLEDAN